MSLSLSQSRLRNLDLLPYEKKVERFAQENPVAEGVRIPNSANFGKRSVKTDGYGNVTAMPLLVGKPCFGVPTAYLRHGRAKAKYVRRRKENVHNSRCDRCKLKVACVSLIRERLATVMGTDLKMKHAVSRWKEARGFDLGGFYWAFKKLGQGGWTAVKHPLTLHGFDSSNDHEIRKSWDKTDAEAKKAASGSRRSQLRKLWKRDAELWSLTEGLDEGRIKRHLFMLDAIKRLDTPSYLAKLSESSAERISAVWWGREFAKLTGRNINPNSIATCLRRHNRNLEKSHSVLRDAVRGDLRRIRKLESNAAYNGRQPIWPKFKHPALI